MSGILAIGAILLVFHLYLLVRWEKVRRPGWFRIGILGFVVILSAIFFFLSTNRDILIVGGVLNSIGLILAFIGAVGSCRPEMLPVIGSAEKKAVEAVEQVMRDMEEQES